MSLNSNYDPTPLAPEVYIYNLSDVLQYTFQTSITQASPTQNFKVRSLAIHLGVNDDYGNAALIIDDPDNNLTDSSLIRRPCLIERQWPIQIYLGKSNATRNRWFYGKIFDVEVIRPNTNLQQIRLSCVGWGVRLKDRITNIKRFQTKESDGLTVDTTDTATRTSELLKDIIQDSDHLTLAGLGVESGFTVTGVDTIDVKLPDLQYDYVTFATVANYLASASNVMWGVDPDRDVYFRDPFASDSGFLFTNDLSTSNLTVQNWSGTKIGYLFRAPYSFTDSTFDGGYSVLHGVGANKDTLDVNDTSTNATYTDNETYHIAIPFTPTKDNLSKISLKMSKAGTPASGDLKIDIIGQDGSSTPEELDLRKSVTLSQAKLQGLSGSGTWTEISFKEITSVIPRTQHFIVISKYGASGNEVNFDYQTGTGTYYRSADGTTWTSQVGKFALRTYHSKPINIIIENTTAKTKFGVREDVVSFRNTTNEETARTALTSMSDILGKEKRIYSDVLVSCPTDRLPLGKYVRVYDVFNGQDIRAGVVGVDISMSADTDGKLGTNKMKLTLEDWFA